MSPGRRLRVGPIAMVTVAAAIWLALPATGALGQTAVSVSDLLDAPEQFAGEVVLVEGELVGDYGFRPTGFMWTQLNGDSYAVAPVAAGGALTGSNVGIGVRMPMDLGSDLDPPGGYRRRGPLVQVVGVWRFHDPGRQGETYLDVRELTVVESGKLLDEDPNWIVYGVGLALIAAAGGLWVSYRRHVGEV